MKQRDRHSIVGAYVLACGIAIAVSACHHTEQNATKDTTTVETTDTTTEVLSKALIKQDLRIDPTIEIVEGMATLQDYADGEGVLFVFINEYDSASALLSNELQQNKEALAKWGGMIYVSAPAEAKVMSWGLPNTDYSLRNKLLNDPIERELRKAIGAKSTENPLTAIVDKEGYVRLYQAGYKSGTISSMMELTAEWL